jgi:hypothetical protein
VLLTLLFAKGFVERHLPAKMTLERKRGEKREEEKERERPRGH